MPDARLPSRWQTDPDRVGLSDAAWRIYSWALMWSAEQWTDGRVPTAAVRMFPVDEGRSRAAVIDELVEAKLWRVTKVGWQILRWEATQTTANEHETRRQQWRDSKRRKRAGVQESPHDPNDGARSDPSVDAEESTEESTWTPEDEEEAEAIGDRQRSEDEDKAPDPAVDLATGEVLEPGFTRNGQQGRYIKRSA
ncbi:hypothetical protein C5C56_16100 [Rathayibacter sp. AY1D1]|uniref:hypothetical protein n=1 Tax=Rathayibacter sp. AY1D1 TaxID=2080542 RepID=UPI000CE90DDA|nr:hypothetical protein [Rathayibacter sp. AY1D1]PPH95691.1 hypothetical protein C5C56_16100 [Rathayibacter sp. AY1D1]